MAETVDHSCRERVTRLEAEVADLKENYAPMLLMERRFNEQSQSIGRIEGAITRTNDNITAMARQFESANVATGQQLKALFEMDSARMQKIAEHQEQLQTEKLAAIRNESAKRIELLEAEKKEMQQRLENAGWINRLKNWKVVLGVLTTVIALMGALLAGLFWVVDYAIKHGR